MSKAAKPAAAPAEPAAVPAEPITILPNGDATPTAVSADEGWEVEDTGRARGGTMAEMMAAGGVGLTEEDLPPNPEDADPERLAEGTPRPDSEIETITDTEEEPDDEGAEPVKRAKPEPGKKGGRRERLEARVSTLKRRVDDATRESRELAAGNVEAARRLLMEQGFEVAPRGERRPTAADQPLFDQPKAAAAKLERPKRPVWSDFEAANKSWADYEAAQADYEVKLEEYHDAKQRAAVEDVRQGVDQRLSAREEEARNEKIKASFHARLDVAQAAIGEEKTAEIEENWREFDAKQYSSKVLNPLVHLHPQGGDLWVQLGDHIEQAAKLSTMPWNRAMFEGVLALPNPAPALLALADDPEAFEEMASLPPADLLVKLGVYAGRLHAGPRANGSQARTISRAPAPIRPVGGRAAAQPRAGGTAYDVDFGPDYVRGVNKQVAGA